MCNVRSSGWWLQQLLDTRAERMRRRRNFFFGSLGETDHIRDRFICRIILKRINEFSLLSSDVNSMLFFCACISKHVSYHPRIS
jgi:hypothetical protein